MGVCKLAPLGKGIGSPAAGRKEGVRPYESLEPRFFRALPLSYRGSRLWKEPPAGFEPATSASQRVCKLMPLGTGGTSSVNRRLVFLQKSSGGTPRSRKSLERIVRSRRDSN